MQNNIPTLYILELDSSVAKSAKISTILYHFVPNIKKHWSCCHGYMEISLKTGIEHRFSLSELKPTVRLRVLLGKLRNFMQFSHGILKCGLIQFYMDVFLDVFHEKTK